VCVCVSYLTESIFCAEQNGHCMISNPSGKGIPTGYNTMARTLCSLVFIHYSRTLWKIQPIVVHQSPVCLLSSIDDRNSYKISKYCIYHDLLFSKIYMYCIRYISILTDKTFQRMKCILLLYAVVVYSLSLVRDGK